MTTLVQSGSDGAVPAPKETLAQRLTFRSGLTIGRHAIRLKKGNQVLAAMVTIPNRGVPRLQILGGKYLSTYRVVGNDLVRVGDRAAYVYAGQFREDTAYPVATIEV